MSVTRTSDDTPTSGRRRLSLDRELLQSVGMPPLDAASANRLLAALYRALELAVGSTLAGQMTDRELDEFQALIDAGDEGGALEWLRTNCPDYADVVSSHFSKALAV